MHSANSLRSLLSDAKELLVSGEESVCDPEAAARLVEAIQRFLEQPAPAASLPGGETQRQEGAAESPQRAAIQRQALQEDLFLLAPEPYVITDPEGVILETNLAARHFLGATESSLRRKALQVFLTNEWARKDFREKLRGLGANDALSLELRLKPYQRETCYVAVSGLKTVSPEHGERILWLLRDLTERIAAEAELEKARAELQRRVEDRTAELRETVERLEHASRAKDEFLGLMSHELRTPLAIMLGNARILRTRFGMLDPADLGTAIKDMCDEGERLQRLIENLMVLAKLDSDRKPELEPVLLVRLFPDSVAAMERRFDGPKIRLGMLGDDLLVRAVPTYLEQIVQNLLGNAMKYGAGSVIDLSAEPEGDQVTISVRDYGPGMSKEESERVFEPFYRTVSAAGTQPGAGVGLTVCKRLVEAQGGRIWVETLEGGGSAFRFTLPLWRDEAE